MSNLNKKFCDLAVATYGLGWVRIAAACKVAPLLRLRVMQKSLDVEPMQHEVAALLRAAREKSLDIAGAMRELEGSSKRWGY
jgi:hypothetical protein